MTLRLGGDGAITGCTSLEEPTLSISGLSVTTPIQATSGTAAAPSYTFSGDTDKIPPLTTVIYNLKVKKVSQ